MEEINLSVVDSRAAVGEQQDGWLTDSWPTWWTRAALHVVVIYRRRQPTYVNVPIHCQSLVGNHRRQAECSKAAATVTFRLVDREQKDPMVAVVYLPT